MAEGTAAGGGRHGASASRQIDMTRGSLADKVLLFAVPVAVTAMLQQLYNVADVAVTGRFVSAEAMAADRKSVV